MMAKDAKKITMDELLAEAGDSLKQTVAGDTIEGKVLSVKKHEILIDLGARGVGLVPRREASFARNLNEGDEVTASVIDAEMKDGFVLLSLRKAVKDKGWDEIQTKLDAAEIVTVTPFDANRGGLLVEYEGIRGFLPDYSLCRPLYFQRSNLSKARYARRRLAHQKSRYSSSSPASRRPKSHFYH